MIKFGSQLPKKERKDIYYLLESLIDLHGDFYITKDNLRLPIKENSHILYKCLESGDKIAYGADGLAFITGWSDKAKRKYIKILSKDIDYADKLLKIVTWNIDCDLWAKVKKTNPLVEILKRNNFKFIGDRGKEILLLRKHKYVDKRQGEENDRDNSVKN